MNFKKFFKTFPDEEACKAHFKAYREREGVICKKCKGAEHYWLSTISYYKCKKCSFKTSLKSGTVMENSKLPFEYWYLAFAMASSTKKPFSALEIQRQIGHKFYQPVWEMMHKIRRVMGKRDDQYQLEDEVEIDEAFFKTTRPIEKDEYGNKVKLKPVKKKTGGKGEDYSSVLVMVESKRSQFNKNKYRPNKVVGFIKMKYVDNCKSETLIPEIKKGVRKETIATTDGSPVYNNLKNVVSGHSVHKLSNKGIQVGKDEINSALPWVHTAISNAKNNFRGTYHAIGKHYTQNYLNEFCFKFNRRFENADVFESLVNASVTNQWN